MVERHRHAYAVGTYVIYVGAYWRIVMARDHSSLSRQKPVYDLEWVLDTPDGQITCSLFATEVWEKWIHPVDALHALALAAL